MSPRDMTPPWTISAWPPALWQPHREPPLHFVHLGTHVSSRISDDWPSMGQTVWGGRAGDTAAGISWDWIEVADGIVALADPMMMTTNLRLLGGEGEVLTAHETAPHLNAVVHALPWQAEVCRALDQSRVTQGAAADPSGSKRSTAASARLNSERIAWRS